jgi:dihydrofolate reductase
MIAIVVAMTKKGKVIGKENKLPWDIPEELNHFRKLTRGGVIIMGRKTYDSIGFPLPGRPNIIVSRNATSIDGCEVAGSVEEAIKKAKAHHQKDIFIIGGSQIVKESFHLADTMLLSYIKKEYPGDTFFPAFDELHWEIERTDDHPEFEFVTYRRK